LAQHNVRWWGCGEKKQEKEEKAWQTGLFDSARKEPQIARKEEIERTSANAEICARKTLHNDMLQLLPISYLLFRPYLSSFPERRGARKYVH